MVNVMRQTTANVLNRVHETFMHGSCARIVRTLRVWAPKCYISYLGATPPTQSRYHATRPARRHRCSGTSRSHLRRCFRAVQPLLVLLSAHDRGLSASKFRCVTRLGP